MINMKKEKDIPASSQSCFWTPPETLSEAKDYVFIEHDSLEKHCSVKLLTGPYIGVIYTYGNVKIQEIENDNGETQGHLSYAFKITEPGLFSIEDLRSNENFKNYIGQILETILNSQEIKIGDINEDNEED